MGGKEYTFDDLRRMVGDVAVRHGIIRVYLFGSRARGDNDADSDYDFCVSTPEDYGLFEVGGFYADLKEVLGVEIDVVCEESLDNGLRKEVIRDRKLLYEA